MSGYLFDTDISSFIMRKYDQRLMRRFQLLEKGDWAISAITYAELLFGLEPLPPFHPAHTRFDGFILDANVIDWPAQAAVFYAEIRNRTRNQPLNDRDIFIAAHAIAIDAILVTNNTRHFSRMGGGLRFENWVE